MKKLLIVFLVLLAASAFAAGSKETTEITFLHSGDMDLGDGTTKFGRAIDALKKDFPDVTVTLMQIDLKDGSTLTMDAMLAAGTPPNILQDTLVRSSKYMVPEYALDLTGYVRDLDKYQDLSLMTTDGAVLALPMPGGPQGMCINMDMMKDIGYAVPENWTIADFMKMAELVKKKYNGTKWATGMFAANQSGDYLINNWFASFGVKFYEGSKTETAIRKTGGAKVYEFFQTLVKNGYVPPNAEILNDDDYALSWSKGELAATAFFEPWTGVYFKSAMEQGLIEKPFEYKFVPFPRAAGVDKVPTYMMYGAFVVHKTGTEKDKYAARLAEYLNSAEVQLLMAKVQPGTIPNRKDAVVKSDNVHVNELNAIVEKNGLFDVGLTNPKFPMTRPTHYPILQKVLTLELTPEQAIREYETAFNAALK